MLINVPVSHSYQIEELILSSGNQFPDICVQSVNHTAQGPTFM